MGKVIGSQVFGECSKRFGHIAIHIVIKRLSRYMYLLIIFTMFTSVWRDVRGVECTCRTVICLEMNVCNTVMQNLADVIILKKCVISSVINMY
jgi:hypothetical protein